MAHLDTGSAYRLRAIMAITFFGHFMVHVYMVIFPVLVPFLLGEFDVDYLVVGLIYTFSNLAFGFGAIGAGYLSDKIGSKRLIVLCALGMAASSFMAGLSTGLETLALALFLLGLFASLYHPASFSLISKAATERGKAFGVHGVGGSVGLAMAPILAGIIALEMGWRWSFLILAIPGLILGVAIALTHLGESSRRHEPLTWRMLRTLMTKGFALTLIIYACYGLTFQGVVGFLPSFLAERGGLIMGGIVASTVTLAMGIPGQLVGGGLTDRVGALRFLMTAFGLLALALVLMAMLPALMAVTVTFAAGFLIFCTQPTTGTLLAEESGQQVRGFAYGLAFMANFGVGAFGTSLGGYVADATGSLVFIFPVMACFMMLGVVIASLLRRERRARGAGRARSVSTRLP